MLLKTRIQYSGAVHLVAALSSRWGDDEEMLDNVHRCMSDYIATAAGHLEVIRSGAGGYTFVEKNQSEPANVDAPKTVEQVPSIKQGIWLRAACSGMYYPVENGQQSISAAGAVHEVLIDGERYIAAKPESVHQEYHRLRLDRNQKTTR